MSDQQAEHYLVPYLDAADRYGAGFGTLLWASPRTQRARFEAISQAWPLTHRRIVDAGCGRADLLDYLLAHGNHPAEYIGIEAVEPLASAAEEKYPGCSILRQDFVRRPSTFFVGAQAIIFSGSLNTLDPPTFYSTLSHAWQAAGEALIFNFLASPQLAGQAYLFWHDLHDVKAFARGLGGKLQVIENYLPGDCTIAVGKPDSA